MTLYVAEEFSDDEADVLRRYFTNLDQPVFALVNLPEVVKGALFARYSRSPKTLRRLFLDEFVGELDIEGDQSIDATMGLERAEELYERVFFEYGDDSVAQLGGVHLACEQASNILTKVLEWGRLMSYLEQSTRYISYDSRFGGRYRYYRPAEILQSPLGTRYVAEMDRMFDSYSGLVGQMTEHFKATVPKADSDSDFVYRQAIRAKAFDSVRGMLPAASTSNVGIYGTGQGYEHLLLRMRAHPLPEARYYADMMLTELRKVIPSFLKRVDIPSRGGAWSDYMSDNRQSMEALSDELFTGVTPRAEVPVRLIDFDPDAEVKLVASMMYAYTDLPEHQLEEQVRDMSIQDRIRIMEAYLGSRKNRRHKPGRAWERPFYRFDVLGDYGAFRDMQRHRMLTIEWQRLTPQHGFTTPAAVVEAGVSEQFNETMERSAQLFDELEPEFPVEASYAVAFAHKIRYNMQFNAREAMHMLELRTTPQGHPAYRFVGQEMHRLIKEEAGHRAIAAMMQYVDHSAGSELERLDAERRAESRRLGAG